jgi:hypothetical protein
MMPVKTSPTLKRTPSNQYYWTYDGKYHWNPWMPKIVSDEEFAKKKPGRFDGRGDAKFRLSRLPRPRPRPLPQETDVAETMFAAMMSGKCKPKRSRFASMIKPRPVTDAERMKKWLGLTDDEWKEAENTPIYIPETKHKRRHTRASNRR